MKERAVPSGRLMSFEPVTSQGSVAKYPSEGRIPFLAREPEGSNASWSAEPGMSGEGTARLIERAGAIRG